MEKVAPGTQSSGEALLRKAHEFTQLTGATLRLCIKSFEGEVIVGFDNTGTWVPVNQQMKRKQLTDCYRRRKNTLCRALEKFVAREQGAHARLWITHLDNGLSLLLCYDSELEECSAEDRERLYAEVSAKATRIFAGSYEPVFGAMIKDARRGLR